MTLKAFLSCRFKEALREAQAADELIQDCDDIDELFEKKPFLGVPFTTKDCFAVEGLSYTAGLLKRGNRNVKADFNADAVELVTLFLEGQKLE